MLWWVIVWWLECCYAQNLIFFLCRWGISCLCILQLLITAQRNRTFPRYLDWIHLSIPNIMCRVKFEGYILPIFFQGHGDETPLMTPVNSSIVSRRASWHSTSSQEVRWVKCLQSKYKLASNIVYIGRWILNQANIFRYWLPLLPKRYTCLVKISPCYEYFWLKHTKSSWRLIPLVLLLLLRSQSQRLDMMLKLPRTRYLEKHTNVSNQHCYDCV